MSDGRRFLDCPACGEPCTEIPPCDVAHRDCVAEAPSDLDYMWCEDRRGVCQCGAAVHVGVDDSLGHAYLVEDDDLEVAP